MKNTALDERFLNAINDSVKNGISQASMTLLATLILILLNDITDGRINLEKVSVIWVKSKQYFGETRFSGGKIRVEKNPVCSGKGRKTPSNHYSSRLVHITLF